MMYPRPTPSPWTVLEYSLPCPVSRFVENGWVVQYKSNEVDIASITIDGKSYNTELNLSKGDYRLSHVYILNVLDDPRPISELSVAGMTFYREGSEDSSYGLKPDMLTMANGLQLGMSVSDALAACNITLEMKEDGNSFYLKNPLSSGESKYTTATSFSFDYRVEDSGSTGIRSMGSLPYGENSCAVSFTDSLVSDTAVVDTIQLKFLYPTAEELAAME